MHHVNTKVLLGLGGVTLVALMSAAVLVTQRQPLRESSVTATALPGLQQQINAVQGITLKVAEDKTAVTLVKNAQGWVVKEKAAYPADTGKLRELLLKLADATLLEPKTTNPERYATLGLTDIKAKDAKGVLVILDGLTPLKQLLVGDVNSRSNATFVRHPDEQQSWLAKGQLNIERDPVQWLDTALVDLPTLRIAELSLTKAGNQPLRIFKPSPTEEKFQLAEMPAGRELQTATVLYEAATTLSSLTLLDVATPQSKALPEESKLLNARFTTFDGVVIELKAWEEEDKHFAQFAAHVDQARADSHIQAEQAKVKADYEAKQKAAPKEPNKPVPAEAAPLAVSDPAKDRQQHLDSLSAEVDGLNRRFNGWHFVIAPYKYSALNKSLEDVLKPLEKAKKPG